HGMEPPQEGNLVIGAMGPVLHEVGNQQHEEQLGKERQPADPFLQRRVDQPAEQAMDGEVDDQQRQSDDQMVDDEMREVDLPSRTEDRLLPVQREHLLDQDEHHAGAQQVENEPVE